MLETYLQEILHGWHAETFAELVGKIGRGIAAVVRYPLQRERFRIVLLNVPNGREDALIVMRREHPSAVAHVARPIPIEQTQHLQGEPGAQADPACCVGSA